MISMAKKLKQRVREFMYGVMDEALGDHAAGLHKSSPETKIALRHVFNYYQAEIHSGKKWALADTGFRIFSQFEEDGMLLYIFAALGVQHQCFVDIGAADGINSNCANLAVNFGWHGLFIEGDSRKIDRGRQFYAKHPDTFLYPPKFVQAFVQRENINELIRTAGYSGSVDLLSIDIDGNDYWVWEVLDVIDPRVVIIELQSKLGLRSLVSPYDKDYRVSEKEAPHFHGASPAAMTKLAAKKGYRLVGANGYGNNAIYVRNGLGEDLLPAVTVESIHAHRRHQERAHQFELVKDREFVTV